MPIRFPVWKLAVFALLSATDFCVTFWLLSRSGDSVYESNPIANEWLTTGGWVGLAAFKAAMVGAVAIIAIYLFYRRPRIAHDVLAVGCGVVFVAVLTGTSIAFTLPRSHHDKETVEHIQDYSENDPDPPHDVYLRNLDEAAERLACGEWSLKHCVEFLASSDLARDPVWKNKLRRTYSGVKDNALLAADLVQHTIAPRVRTLEAVELAAKLEAEFHALYGYTPHLPYKPLLNLSPR